MELASRRFADAVILSPAGRIDHATADGFRQALFDQLTACAADKARVIVDLSRVEYIASVGLRALMLAAKQAKADGYTFVLADLQPLVREIFEISKFTLVFTIHPTVRDALAATSAPALAAFDAA